MANSFRDQEFALRRQLEELLPCRERRRVQVSLTLSDAAKTEPLRSPVLQRLRDMILREGAFRGIDPIPKQFNVFSPPVGLVVPGSEVAIRSLGWGKVSIRDGNPVSCGALGCSVNALQVGEDTSPSQCPNNTCGTQGCGALGCVTNTCGDQICGTLDCQTNNLAPAVIDDLVAETSHPFVREVIDFAGTSDMGAVADEILAYTTFGAVDTSLLTK